MWMLLMWVARHQTRGWGVVVDELNKRCGGGAAEGCCPLKKGEEIKKAKEREESSSWLWILAEDLLRAGSDDG